MSAIKRKADSIKGSALEGGKKAKLEVSTSKDHPVLSLIQRKSSTDPEDSYGSEKSAASNTSEPSEKETRSAARMENSIHPDRVRVSSNTTSIGMTSKEAHAKQKLLVAERKASKPLAEELTRTKKIWERLRRKSHVPLAERRALVEELFGIITGRVKDYVLKHDSVRVIQTAVRYANAAQKRSIAKELQGSYRQLAESRYAKFLIGKLLVQGDNEIRDMIVPEFFGHVRRLIKHPEASWILDDVYRGIATLQQKAIILREWYGAEFALFGKESEFNMSAQLKDIIIEEPAKRATMMRSLHELINHLIQKKMTGFTLLHDAMLQYFQNARPDSEEQSEFIELLKSDESGDLLKNLAFTKSGSRVVSLALAYGNAKDRKHILRIFKSTFQLIAGDPNGYIIVLAAYEVIDDTVLTAKSIFPELLGKDLEMQSPNIVSMANNIYARTTLLYLFQGRSKSLFPLSLCSDLEFLSIIDTIREKSSKKDPVLRRQELGKAFAPPLLTAISSTASDLVTTSFGCQLITDVIFAAQDDRSAALKAVALTAAGCPEVLSIDHSHDILDNDTKLSQAPQTHLALTPHGGKMLKALLSGGRFDRTLNRLIPVHPPMNFADILFPHIKDHLLDWAAGPGAFVIVTLLEAENFSQKPVAIKDLRSCRKELENSVYAYTTDNPGTAIEPQKLEAYEDGRKDKKKKKKKRGADDPVGRKGTAIVLKLIG